MKMKKQTGQTLIQMIGISAAAGLLLVGAAVVISQSSNDKERAAIIYQASQKIMTDWTVLNNQSSSSTQVAGNPNLAAGKSALDIIATGEISVAPDKIINYKKSGITPLSILLTPDGGQYKIFNSHVQLEGGGDMPLELSVKELSINMLNVIKASGSTSERDGKLYIALAK